MKILRPQPRPIASELAFYQDHEVPCMHINVPESLLHCLFPIHQLKVQDSKSLSDGKATIKGA